jgi:uncharacterized phiE125 gp8 family phage protein
VATTLSPVALADFKVHQRIAFDDDDAYVEGLLDAATEAVEKLTGKVMLPRAFERVLCGFTPALEIRLRHRPLVSVTSIEYVDTAGETQTLAADRYTLDLERARIYPAWGTCWPAARLHPGSVTVAYVAGYENAAAVPRTLKQAVTHLAALWYAAREPIVVGTIVADVPYSIKILLGLERKRYC